MKNSRHARRQDENHGEVADAAREFPGVTVANTHTIGDGFPDVLVGGVDCHGRGFNIVVEIKPGPGVTRDKRRWLLNASEEEWHAMWTGPRAVVRSAEEMRALVRNALNGVLPGDRAAQRVTT